MITRLFAVFIAVAFAFAGRFVQLYPERLVPKGQFTGTNSVGARLYRLQTKIVGTFMVFAGTAVAIFELASLLRPE